MNSKKSGSKHHELESIVRKELKIEHLGKKVVPFPKA